VIPVGGKNSLDRPCLIFQKFGIRVYTVWDNDKNNKDVKPRENQILLRTVGGQSCDWPCGVYEKYTCFESKLEDVVRSEVGQAKFNSRLGELQEEFGYNNREDAVKNPALFGKLLSQARDQ